MIFGVIVKVRITKLRTSDSGKVDFVLSGDPTLPERKLVLFQDTVPVNSPSSALLLSHCNCLALQRSWRTGWMLLIPTSLGKIIYWNQPSFANHECQERKNRRCTPCKRMTCITVMFDFHFHTVEYILPTCTTELRRGSYECSRFILNKNQRAIVYMD